MIASLEEFKVLLKQRERGRQINEQGISEKLKDNSGSEHTSFKLKAAKGTIICPRHRT